MVFGKTNPRRQKEKFENIKGKIRSEIEIGQTIQWPKEKEQKDNDLQNTTQKYKWKAHHGKIEIISLLVAPL